LPQHYAADELFGPDRLKEEHVMSADSEQPQCRPEWRKVSVPFNMAVRKAESKQLHLVSTAAVRDHPKAAGLHGAGHAPYHSACGLRVRSHWDIRSVAWRRGEGF